MGLLTGLLTLPLAPLRGTVWLAEQLADQAAQELDEERSIRRQLADLERRHVLGELTLDEMEQMEDELLARLHNPSALDAGA